MPILSPEYISTWYYFKDAAGYVRLFESWTERQEQDVERVRLLQGDIGTHVMNVGGIKWVTKIESPALIVETGPQQIDYTTDAFDLLAYSMTVIRNPFLQMPGNNLLYVLKNASITIGQEGVKLSLEYISSVPGAFQPHFVVDLGTGFVAPDFIARTARFYDTIFRVADEQETYTFTILSGTINIQVDVTENYFLNQTDQAPYLSVQGYHISGSVTIATPPSSFFGVGFNPNYDSLPDGIPQIRPQIPGQITASRGEAGLQIGTTYVPFGLTNMRKSVERSMNPDKIGNTKIDFETFARVQGD